MSEHDVTFEAMGSHVRLIIGEPGAGLDSAEAAACRARQFITHFDRELSRFRNDSELSRFNRDPRERVPASELLRSAVRAGQWAAARSKGVVDPTLVAEIEAAGYRFSRNGLPGVPLARALAEAPPRAPAGAARHARWNDFTVSEIDGTIARPPGVRFDSGGVGKGLAADMVADMLTGYSRFVVDCGGDIRIGGPDSFASPVEVHMEHPLSGDHAHVLRLGSGGVATSGLNIRIWRCDDGCFAHHLLDPATGEPAWTGLIGATALGDTALEAETLAKTALLSGPARARAVLGGRGGLIVHESGRVEPVGPLRIRPRIRLPQQLGAAA